jgi:hypothetical protein
MTYPASYSLNRQIQRVLYALKRQYGGAIVVYQNQSVATDPKTGEVTRTKTAVRIQRAVVLPVTISREVKQAISVISANKMAVSGGSGFETGKRLFIIDRRDAPTLTLTASDWIGYDGRRYAIESFEEYEFSSAWIVVGKALIGEDLGVGGSIVEQSAATNVVLTSASEGEV